MKDSGTPKKRHRSLGRALAELERKRRLMKRLRLEKLEKREKRSR